MVHHENNYLQYSDGMLNDYTLSQIEYFAAIVINNIPYNKEWWERNKESFQPDYVDFMDSHLDSLNTEN